MSLVIQTFLSISYRDVNLIGNHNNHIKSFHCELLIGIQIQIIYFILLLVILVVLSIVIPEDNRKAIASSNGHNHLNIG